MKWVVAWVLTGCGAGDGPNQSTGQGDGGDDTAGPAADWTAEMVSDRDLGLQSQLVVGPDDTVSVATWSNEPTTDGQCDDIATTRLRHDLVLVNGTAGAWTEQVVDSPVVAFSPTGLSLALDPEGDLAIAYTGGDPEGDYCGANDAVLAVAGAGGWTFDTAAADSGESATGMPASDSGFVVGLWPGLAYDHDGNPAILHKDAHFGGLQHDDSYRADAELAWSSGSSWAHLAVDAGEGAGDYGSLLFDAENRPVALYAITVEAQEDSRHGVWAARQEAGGEWTAVKLHTGAIDHEVVGSLDPVTGDLVVVFYSKPDQAVRVRRLQDGADFADSSAWADELVASGSYDEGQNVSLAFAPDGGLALSFHRCKLLSSTASGCDQNDEAVVYATHDGDRWQDEVVMAGDIGSCGEYTALGFDSRGVAHVAFRCTVEDGAAFSQRLFIATRSP